MKITIEINDKEVIARLKELIEVEARRAAPPPCAVPKDMPVGELQLTVRTENCLRGENIRTVDQLVAKSGYELSRVPNLGKKALGEIKEVLAARGWHLAKKP